MKIVSARIENILSLEKADISFGDSGLVLIEGWNYDDGRATGAGKTAIFNAICFGIYGKVPKKITASEVLRYGTKKGSVEVDIQAGLRLITVRRERPNKLFFVENGVTLEMTQEEFESIIKLSYEQFLVSMYTAQRANNKFIDKNDSEKKDFLLQLMSLNEFNACKKEADVAIKTLQADIVESRIKKNTISSKVEVYKEAVIPVEAIDLDITTSEAEINKLNTKLTTLQSVPKPDFSKYGKLEEGIKGKHQEFAKIRAQKSMLHGQYKTLALQDKPFTRRDPDASCPHCEGELNIRGNSVVKADDMEALQAQHDLHLAEVRKNMSALKQQIDILDTALLKEQELFKLTEQLKVKKQAEFADYDAACDSIADIRSLINNKTSFLDSKRKSKKDQFELTDKIQQFNDILEKLDIELLDKANQINLYEAISALYSPVGAQAYILDSLVDSFNESVSHYVDLVWPNASYKLNAFKEKKDGDVTAKFSEFLVINGKEKSIGQLSGGEFRALTLILDFTVIDILSKQFGMPLNPIILDEPFEGLDAVGRETIIELLEKLSQDRQICVIDHASEAKAMFSKVIRVEKRQDTSRLVEPT